MITWDDTIDVVAIMFSMLLAIFTWRKSRREKNYLLGTLLVPEINLATAYILAQFAPFSENLVLRQSIVRPAIIFLLAGFCLYIGNGRLNRLLGNAINWMRRRFTWTSWRR